MADKIEAERRKQRLAKALRENLKKRKARASENNQEGEPVPPFGTNQVLPNQPVLECTKDEGSHFQSQ